MDVTYPKTRAEEIFDMIQPFCENYFSEELGKYTYALLLTVQRNRKLNIFRGDINSWAAAIVYIIARLNFLFDKDDAHSVTPDIICDYYKTKINSTKLKADHIIEVCDIVIGDKKFSGRNITSMFDFYKTKVGFVVHKSALESSIKNIEALDKEEGQRLRTYIAHKSRLAEKKLQDRLIQRAKKNHTGHKGQLDLFG